MATYREKLEVVTDFVNDNIYSIEELCSMFDISLEDVVKCFPDKLVKGYGKVTGEYDADEEEQEAWAGFSIEDE